MPPSACGEPGFAHAHGAPTQSQPTATKSAAVRALLFDRAHVTQWMDERRFPADDEHAAARGWPLPWLPGPEDGVVGAEEQLDGRLLDRVIIIGVRADGGRRRRRGCAARRGP